MQEQSAPQQIDAIIKLYGGWKGPMLSRLRGVIRQADPEMVEEVKWRMRTRPEGLPAWSHDGIICIAETFKDNIKLVFFKGVHIDDPKKLFNARLKSATDRAIEFHDGDIVDEEGVRGLVKDAVRLNKEARRK